MLEVRNLSKVYKPKKGVPVRAIDNISLKFPDKGMVFLLGKSGSGKSTLLNLLGGLDKYDSGEIIIKEVSSSSFKQRHFDSYRNTYLGFIFQEYNILEEFNVGANIALALELQGRKATDEEINRILQQVDLEGYGNRKPNELSGGQKQRVAIARALVKDPEIIMADEPTGALDSATGRQVLDTLKKLSAEKLVIVVSHDREFAEKYADRIIELADGRVINDMEYFGEEGVEEVETNELSNLSFGEDVVTVAPSYHLSETDLEAINAWLDQRKGGKITVKSSEKSSGRRSAKPTDESRIASTLRAPFNLIKSKLPMKNAFKIGASGLKYKKFRLVITILLSCISFGLFGLADTFGCYNHINACTRSIMDSNIHYASFEKNYKFEEEEFDYVYWRSYKLKDEDIATIEKDLGMKLAKGYEPGDWDDMFDTQFDTSKKFTETSYHIYAPNFNGLAEVSGDLLKDMKVDIVAGKLPDGTKDEIAITTYLAQTFIIGGYREPESDGKFEEIKEPADMVGKVIQYGPKKFTVTGVVDTHFDLDRYIPLTKEKKNSTNADDIMNYALLSELNSAKEYSLISMALVGEGYVDGISNDDIHIIEEDNGYCSFSYSTREADNSEYEEYYGLPTRGFLEWDLYKNSIVWFDGAKDKLADDEIVVTEETFKDLMFQCGFEGEMNDFVKEMPKIQRDAWSNEKSHGELNGPVKIVGYVPSNVVKNTYAAIMNDEMISLFCVNDDLYKGAKYDMAIGAMPSTFSDIKKVVNYSYRDEQIRYSLANPVTFELDGLNEIFEVLGRVFFWIGVGFALFASIMLANFISTSISYKKQEIGILRAIGARGSDVFRIFFSESFIIAMINFVLSATGTGIVTAIINMVIRTRTNILVTILIFNIRQIALLFAVSILVAALASFFPVWHIAKKRPIDAIRNR